LRYAEYCQAIAEHVFHGTMAAAKAQWAYVEMEQDRGARLWVSAAVAEERSWPAQI
jgi:hypothetical protein